MLRSNCHCSPAFIHKPPEKQALQALSTAIEYNDDWALSEKVRAGKAGRDDDDLTYGGRFTVVHFGKVRGVRTLWPVKASVTGARAVKDFAPARRCLDLEAHQVLREHDVHLDV